MTTWSIKMIVSSVPQESLQFYDTPRNVREAMSSPAPNPNMMPGNYGNYDIPNPGSLPVFRKPCGCVMRLTSVGGEEQVVDEITLLTVTSSTASSYKNPGIS